MWSELTNRNGCTPTETEDYTNREDPSLVSRLILFSARFKLHEWDSNGARGVIRICYFILIKINYPIRNPIRGNSATENMKNEVSTRTKKQSYKIYLNRWNKQNVAVLCKYTYLSCQESERFCNRGAPVQLVKHDFVNFNYIFNKLWPTCSNKINSLYIITKCVCHTPGDSIVFKYERRILNMNEISNKA